MHGTEGEALMQPNPTVNSEDFIRRVFKDARLVSFAPQELKGLQLSEEDIQFLTSLGLPNVEVMNLSFDKRKFGLRPLGEFVELKTAITESRDRVLGGNEYELVMIGRHNHIEDFDRTELKRRIANTSIRTFVACCAAFIEYVMSEHDPEDELQVRAAIRRLETRICGFDPGCLDGADNFWSLILEQVNDRVM